jgi:hypothetical protein
VPRASFDEVEQLVRRWLSAKGFEPRPDPALFECDNDSERGLGLFANDQWAVVIYSKMQDEGDRLIHELGKLGQPILRFWVHDSDLWGYDLHHDGELVASFNSNPGYCGTGRELVLATNGDPALLQQLCPISLDEEEIARLQRRRAVFKEDVCRRFCTALGVEPAGIGFRDLEEMGASPGDRVRVAGFQMELHYFLDRSRDGRGESRPLHAQSFLRFEPSGPPLAEIDPELAESLRAYASWIGISAQLIGAVTFVLGLVLWPVTVGLGLLLGGMFRLYVRWRLGRILAGREADAAGSVWSELQALARPLIRLEGRRLLNDPHRCAITLPDDAEPSLQGGLPFIFHFRLGKLDVFSQAIRARDLSARFRLVEGVTILSDNNFQIGALPARAVIQCQEQAGRVVYQYWYLVEAPQAYYYFGTWSETELMPEVIDRLQRIVSSFQLLN